MQVATIIRDPRPDRMPEGAKVEESNAALMQGELDLSTIMVQVLRRGSDPICPGLEQALHTWVSAGMGYQQTLDSFGGWIDVARNWQSWLFIKAKAFKFLLLVDSDVTPPINAPILLARHDKPIVSGIVGGYNKERGGLFACIAVKGPDGKARFPTLNATKRLPARGIVKVHNSGAGCLLVRRDVLETLWSNHDQDQESQKIARDAILKVLEGGSELTEKDRSALWKHIKRFDPVHDVSGPPFSIPDRVRFDAAKTGIISRGEDICFTDRAREAGFDIYADFECQCGHDKLLRLAWPTDLLDPELSVEDWMTSAYDAPVVQE